MTVHPIPPTDKPTRLCIKCREYFPGMMVIAFRSDRGLVNPTPYRQQLMCIECGSNGGNYLPVFKYAGVISEGTLKAQDLIDNFGNVLDDLNSGAAQAIWCSSKDTDLTYEQNKSETVIMLHEALEEAAPTGYEFGSHEGDPACFGFWEIES